MASKDMIGQSSTVSPAASASTPTATPRASRQASTSAQSRQKPRMSEYSPLDEILSYEAEELDLDGGIIEADLQEQLAREKQLYPGASTWAEDEEKLFEILFCRQDLPILPAHWEVDLRGVPIAEANFTSSEEQTALVYAHAKEFQATTALVRLIDLTANVRTAAQSGLRHRTSAMIKKGLDQFLSWAAEDGGYSHLRAVPNIITEVIDKNMQESDITDLMQSRMRALARLQREFLRVDRDPKFWNVADTEEAAVSPTAADDTEAATMDKLLIQKYLSPRGKRTKRRSYSMDDELASLPVADATGTPAKSDAPKRRRAFKSPSNEPDELSQDQPSSSSRLLSTPPSATREIKRLSPHTPPDTVRRGSGEPKYRRKLPVVYGFFVLNACVLVLTVDSAKGDNAYVSFHVETDFMNKRQSVWNALTIAIVACLARDELKQRMGEFEIVDGLVEESDPDV